MKRANTRWAVLPRPKVRWPIFYPQSLSFLQLAIPGEQSRGSVNSLGINHHILKGDRTVK
jgi:hypothetical protein